MLQKHFRIYEHLHIPIWLIKDTCWALEFKLLGVCMIFPTLGLALMLIYKTRHKPVELFPNIAITLWITANSIWMCDEFFTLGIKNVCYIPFALGLAVISYWLLFHFPAIWKKGNPD